MQGAFCNLMRLIGLDIARFFAFVGMVLVNFRIAAMVDPGPDLASKITHLLEGRAAALFVLLAGIGLSLARLDRMLLVRRAVFLFVLGSINLLVFDADILHFYALYFLCALPFLNLSARALFASAALITLASPLLHLVFEYDRGWDWDTLIYADFLTPAGFIRHSLFNGWHPVFPWVAFLLIGMGLGRLDLGSIRLQTRLIVLGALMTVVGLVPGWLAPAGDLHELLNTAPIPPGPFYILSGAGSAICVTALILRLMPNQNPGWAAAMALAGRQSLTLYLAHILLGMGLLDELGMLDGSLSSQEIFVYSLGFCALCPVYAWIWSRRYSRGPLEALMRKWAG